MLKKRNFTLGVIASALVTAITPAHAELWSLFNVPFIRPNPASKAVLISESNQTNTVFRLTVDCRTGTALPNGIDVLTQSNKVGIQTRSDGSGTALSASSFAGNNGYAVKGESNGTSIAGYFSNTDGKRSLIVPTGLTGLGITNPSYRLDVQDNAAANGIVFSSRYTGTGASDKIAVVGIAAPQPYYGVGGQFIGGYKGVEGYANASGTGTRFGGYFSADYGSVNYGLYSSGSTYAGYFSGNVYVSGTFTNPSDEKFKKNITSLDNVLDKIRKIRPVSFEYDMEKYSNRGFTKGKKVGVIAQEIANVFPDLVTEEVAPNEDKSSVNSDNTFKSVNYLALIPILTKAIQEQQSEIDQLKKEIKQIKADY